MPEQPLNISYEGLVPFLKEWREQREKESKRLIELARLSIEQMPVDLRRLANHGWYISANNSITDAAELATQLAEGKVRKVNNYLKNFYQRESKPIISHLKKEFPERSKLLNEALKAHERRMYFASTLLFLSIADGICNGNLYIIKKNKEKLKKQLSNKSHLLNFLTVVEEVNAIDTPHRSKNNFQSDLNRHGALHGLDFDYGTKLNSLRALSLLAFIGDFSPRN